MTTFEGLVELKDRLVSGWLQPPGDLAKHLAALTREIYARPDQTATLDAQTFLAAAQMRLADYRKAMRSNKAAEIASEFAKATYETYCLVADDELNALYKDVERDFGTFYRIINEDDEAEFTAKFTPSAGRLDLQVNFYERGLFPPRSVS